MKNDAPIRSDSWASSSAELDDRNAKPWTWLELSRKNGGIRDPPLIRVKLPDAQLSTIAMWTSAGTSRIRWRSRA